MSRSLAALALLVAMAAAAHAQGTLERVRQSGVLRCAAGERPGFAEADEQGAHGLAVDLCRAVAIAAIGPQAQVQFQLPDSDLAFGRLPGAVDLVFMSGAEFAEHRLTRQFIPGPVVFIDTQALMVPQGSAAMRPEDLAGRIVCLMIGSPAERALEATLAALRPPVIRLPFREDVEMLDAYNVGRCDAIVDDVGRLAEARRENGINRLHSRVLDRPLGLTPLLAATPSGDGDWAAIVGWALIDMLQGGSAGAMPVPAMSQGWQGKVLAGVGSYAQMLERNLGANSPLGLAVAPNAAWPQGLLVTIAP